jgi:integrase
MKIWREKDKKLGIWLWKADFTHKGKRKRPGAVKKEDLLDIITQIKSNALRKEVGLESRAPKITLKQLFDEHIRTFDLAKKTHRRGKVVLKSFLKYAGEDTPVGDVETVTVFKFISWRKEKSLLKPESVNKEVGYISSMLGEAPNYFKQLAKYERPKMPWEAVAKDTNQRVIYEDEREQLIQHLRHETLHEGEKPSSRLARFEYADMFEIAYHTAMRWGEVHLIEWHMIDWRKAELYLPADITKTKSGRTVYLNSRAIEILQGRKAVSVSKYVFPGNTPDVPRKYYYEGIRRAAKKLGLPFGRDVGFTLHNSRHTAITNIIHKTGDFAAAQMISGHSEKTMVMKYTHTNADRIKGAVEGLIDLNDVKEIE